MVASDAGISLPIAYAIVSSENASAYATLLACVVHNSGGVVPAQIMTDNSATIASALSLVFEDQSLGGPQHILCIWHSNANLHKATKSNKYLGANVSTEERSQLYKHVTRLTKTQDEKSYIDYYHTLKRVYKDKKFSQFLKFF